MPEALTSPAPAGGAQISAGLVTVTPKLAEHLLARNTHNRGISKARVEQYAGDMRRGEWQLNGEAIKIAVDERILDGQHRLVAVLEADVDVQMLVISGLPHAAQETMDQGRNRTMGDVLKLRGEKSCNTLASAARIVCCYELHGRPFTDGYKAAPSISQTSRTLDRNPDLRASCALAARTRRPWLPISTAAGLHYLFSIADPAGAEDFFAKLCTGAALDVCSPIYVLRERLLKEHHDTGEHTISIKVKMALIVKAWNAYQAGEQPARLTWRPGGANPEPFPLIAGLADAAGALSQGGGGPEMPSTPPDYCPRCQELTALVDRGTCPFCDAVLIPAPASGVA